MQYQPTLMGECDGCVGSVCAMASDEAHSGTSRQPDLAMRNELTTQLSLAPARFVVVNTAGVVELEKRRPVDSLAIILEQRSAAMLEQFFRSYGPAEVAAMCFMLATQLSAVLPQVQKNLQEAYHSAVCIASCQKKSCDHECSNGLLKRSDPSEAFKTTNIVCQCTLQAVVQQAKRALESPRLTGEAVIKEAGSTHGDQNVPPNQGFDMGQVSIATTVHQSIVHALAQEIWLQHCCMAAASNNSQSSSGKFRAL